MPLPLEEYALIGDCHTAALVGADGSIDWLCLPRFDAPACFAALLGTPENGRWLLAPTGVSRGTRRRYRGDSLILETDFETDSGAITVVDFMPFQGEIADVIRMVQGRRGEVQVHMELVLRFDYGSFVPWVQGIDGGIAATAGPDRMRLRSPVSLEGKGLTTVATFTVREGEQVAFDLTWYPSHHEPPPVIDVDRALEETAGFWCRWAGRCSFQGPWRDEVVRSLITLKALTYAPTGGLVAAPTTSLPETLGGVRNWDYRYCWLRDATFTLLALLHAGYRDEARAWREWLLRAAAGAPSQLHIMYGIAGERRLPELELPWLPGYEGAAPVRTGNAAHAQLQIDVFGEVMDVMHQSFKSGLDSTQAAWRLERALMDFLEGAWDRPDNGIWEMRGPSRHFTHSKMMAWVAVDRAVKAVERHGVDGPVDRWRRLRGDIHAQVCREGYDAGLNAFVQFYGSKRLDASLLMMPLVGFLPIHDARVRGTVAAIERQLVRHGFVARYDTTPEVDGLPAGEGAFLLCSFWLADNLALLGRRRDARRLFERLLAVRSDVGLLSESYDVGAQRLVGNYPQAFSHVGLINTARNLARTGGPADDRRED